MHTSLRDTNQTCVYSLFSGIRQLVLSAAVVGLLDAWIGPQHLNGVNVGLIKRRDLLDVHLLHQHGVGLQSNYNPDTGH